MNMRWPRYQLDSVSIAKGQYGGGFSAIEYQVDKPRYVRITDINDSGKLNEDYVSPSGDPDDWNRYYLENGDLLFARSGATVGKTYLHRSKSIKHVYAGYLIRFRIDPDIAQPDYVYYYTKSKEYRYWVLNKQNVVAQPNINAKQYGQELKISLPPLPVQKKITNILDAADEYRQKTKALIEKYDQLAESLFLEMFGDPVRNEKGWEIADLENLCIKITDGTHHSPEPQSSGIPYVTAKHVKEYGLDFNRNPSYVSQEAHNEIFKRCMPEYGDVLYIKDGATTGVACINTFREPISLLSSLSLLKLNTKRLRNYYLVNWLNHNGVKNRLLNEFMSGAAIKRYTLKKIKKFQIPVPPIDLQILFAERVKMLEDQESKAASALEKAEDLFQSLLQRAFKGELVN